MNVAVQIPEHLRQPPVRESGQTPFAKDILATVAQPLTTTRRPPQTVGIDEGRRWQAQYTRHGQPPTQQELYWRTLNREMRPEIWVEGLEHTYVIENRQAVDAFIADNRAIRNILLPAEDILDRFFGKVSIKVLSLLEDDEEVQTLFCWIMFPGDLEEAQRALRNFDREWWLERCGLVAGRLNFDFQLI